MCFYPKFWDFYSILVKKAEISNFSTNWVKCMLYTSNNRQSELKFNYVSVKNDFYLKEGQKVGILNFWLEK